MRPHEVDGIPRATSARNKEMNKMVTKDEIRRIESDITDLTRKETNADNLELLIGARRLIMLMRSDDDKEAL